MSSNLTFCPQQQKSVVKMKSLIIFLFVIAAVFAEQDVFEAGHSYLILGNNNKFLSVINYGGVAGVRDYIESIKNQQDTYCRFVASTLHNGKIALTSAPRKMYLRLRGGYIQTTPHGLGTRAQFEVEVEDPISEIHWPGAHYVYLKANNGKYLGIESNTNKMVATYDTKETATRLIVLEAH